MHLISEANQAKLQVFRDKSQMPEESTYIDCFEGCITKSGIESTSCQAKNAVWEKMENAAIAAGASKILIHYSSLDGSINNKGERVIIYLCAVSFYK